LNYTEFNFLADTFAYAPESAFTIPGDIRFGNEYVVVLDGNIMELGQSGHFPSLTLRDNFEGDVLKLIINPDYSKIQISSQLNVS
jgi:hypothetical protein